MTKELLLYGGIILALSLFPPAILILLFYDISSLHFCLEAECLAFLSSHLAIPIRVFTFSFYAIAVIVAVLQLRVSQLARQSQSASSHASNCLAHLNEFSAFVRGEIKLIDGIDTDVVSTQKLHKTLFPDLSLFSIQETISKGVHKNTRTHADTQILTLANLVDEDSQKYGVPSGNFSFEKHQEAARKLLDEIGISVDELPEQHYYAAERASVRLLNRLTRTFRPDLPEICENPAYGP